MRRRLLVWLRFLAFPLAAFAGSIALVACGDDDGGFMFTDSGSDTALPDTGGRDSGTPDTGPDAGGEMGIPDATPDAREGGSTEMGVPDGGRAEMGAPPTLTATFEPMEVCTGSDVTVSWTTTGANRLELLQSTGRLIVAVLDRGEVAMGEFPTPVPGDGVIRVRAIGPGGMTEERLEVRTRPGAAVTEFTATPMTLGSSGTTTLRWATVSATSVEITAEPGGPLTIPGGMIDSGMLAVPLTESTVFTLRATGSCDERASASVRVTVYTRPPDVTFTIENATSGGPAAASTTLAWRDRARIRWTTTDAETVSISGFDGYFEDGVVGSFEDISATGSDLDAVGDDSWSSPFPIGFSFPLFGTPITMLSASTNGYVAASHESYSPYSPAFPYSGAPDGIIAALWDDLTCDAGQVVYQTLGTAPNRRTIIQWTNITTLGGEGPLTFQIVLFENGRIEMRYRDLAPGIDGGDQGVGIESPDGTRSFEVVLYEPGRIMAGGGFGIGQGSAKMGELEFSPTENGEATLTATNPMGTTERTVRWTVMAPADTGCGPGVRTVTLPAPDMSGHILYTGDTSATGSMELTELAMCGGTNTGPEVAHLLTMPYDADVEAFHNAPDFDDLVIAARRECRNPASTSDCQDSTGSFGTVSLTDVRAGETIAFIIDAYSTASGAYELDVQLRRRLAPGAMCTDADLCGGGTECVGGTCTMVPMVTETTDFGSTSMPTAIAGRTTIRGTLTTMPPDRDCFTIAAPAGGSLAVGMRTGPSTCTSDLTAFITPPVGDITTVDGDRADPYCDFAQVPAATGGDFLVCISSRSGAVVDPNYYLLDLIPSTLPPP
ncbi:MAG: hypothetical protein IT379_40610 [Deltaproteobacteria bacterium]|nr:hypothetical protein [Deltaproteobacteria bacterium]